jgi:hypothetical protein
MDIERIEASYQRINTVWRADSALDKRIDRALLSDLLDALEEVEPSARSNRLTDRITELFDTISDSLG